MSNVEVRTEIMRNGLKHWEVAAELGISETSFSRKMRMELPDDDRERVLAAIKAICRSRNGGDCIG